MTEEATAREKALAFCQRQVIWYETHGRPNRRWFQGSQIVTVIAGVIAPFFAAGVGLDVPPLIRAAPAALAALAYGLNSVLHWGENWQRFAWTTQSLESARVAFETQYALAREDKRAGLITAFVDEVNRIVSTETQQWSAQLGSQPGRQQPKRSR